MSFYFKKIDLAVQEALATHPDSQRIVLIGHSIGGWIARAWLSEWCADEEVKSKVRVLLTLGSPHSPPPSDSAVAALDQTRGLLSYINANFPGKSLSLIIIIIVIVISIVAAIQTITIIIIWYVFKNNIQYQFSNITVFSYPVLQELTKLASSTSPSVDQQCKVLYQLSPKTQMQTRALRLYLNWNQLLHLLVTCFYVERVQHWVTG